MSISLMTLAWKCDLPSGPKMVLLALCDNANDQGECFPSVSMLAKKCSMAERSVFNHITYLEKIGAIQRHSRSGRSTIYQINPCKFCTPANSAPLQPLHPTPATVAPPPLQPLHPTPATVAPITINEPSIEPSGKHQRRAKAAPTGFDPLAELLKAGVDGQTAKDWLQHRKKKRADVTATVLNEHSKQAALAGLSLEDALKISCSRGWQGFEAKFVVGDRNPATAKPAANVSHLGRAGQETAQAASRLMTKYGVTANESR